LKGRVVEIISDFYNSHDIKLREFGSDLGSLNWKDIGLNSYGNSLIVNGAFFEKNPKLTEDFVRITQKAYAACVADFERCLKALLAGDRSRPRRAVAAMGPHQIPDGGRIHDDQGARLDRRGADAEGL
jgi:hypothetical protein